MDIKKFEKISNAKIVAGKKTRDVRNMLKQYKEERQDAFEGVSEIYKPLIDTQESVKETIDKKQDQLIVQLQDNQKTLSSGLDNLILYNQLSQAAPEVKQIEYQPSTSSTPAITVTEPTEPKKTKLKAPDIDNGFDDDDVEILEKYNLHMPSEVFKRAIDGSVDIDNYNVELGKIRKLSGEKGRLSRKSVKEKNAEEIKDFTKDLNVLQKYRNRINVIPEGLKSMKTGEGFYTQRKRNAYKVDKNGIYGGLIIDLPKLFGQLRMVAHKDGKKVYDTQADFDTIDLFTKRFNSKKKYSPLSKGIFNDINTLSEIPIHRSSNKFKKLGYGVIYYNNPEDLLSRLELLGASILAGNNGVKNEFTQVAHALNKIGIVSNDQLNDLLKEYVI